MENHAHVSRPWQGIRRAIGAAFQRAPVTLAALTCTGVGIYYNASFAASYGPAAIALAVASDVLKSLAGTTMLAAWRNAEYAKAAASFIALIVTLTVSLVAAFGSAQHSRETATDDRASKIAAYDSAAADVTRLQAELAALGTPRPVAVIQTEVQTTRIDMGLWRRSSQCSDISREDTRAACEPILTLYKERGNAARKAEVEPLLAAAKAKLEAIGTRPANADPQAHAIAAVTGVPEDTIRLATSALMVALIEVGAIGGSIMARAPRVAPQPEPVNEDTAPASPTPPKRRGRHQKNLAVVRFVADFKKRHGRAPSHPELRAAFAGISKAAAQRYRVAA